MSSFYTGVQKRMSELQAEARKSAVNAPELRKQLAQKREEGYNIRAFIAKQAAVRL